MSSRSIRRSDFLKVGLLGGFTLAAQACARHGGSGASKPSTRPNFVIVLADDLAFRAVGYNNPVVKTPHLDRLGHEGVIFDRAYIATPICAASRASLLTGLYPQEHGVIALDGSGFCQSVSDPAQFSTVAQCLSHAGYDTAFCGKSHLGAPQDYGFAAGEELNDITDDQTFVFAKRFIAGRAEQPKPFLLWVATRQPHVPLEPLEEWLDLYRDVVLSVDPNFRESPPPESIYNQGLPGEHYYRDSEYTKNYKGLAAGPPRSREAIGEFMRAYYAVISRLDQQIGILVKWLKEAGAYEDTVLLFVSDNGYHLGNHGLGNKITMHEESVRVPMLVHGPGLKRTSVRSQALVSSVDLFPTLLDMAGAPIPESCAGLSLVPLLDGAQQSLRPYVASECVGVGGTRGMGHRMVRTDRWKYVLTDTDEEWLFDANGDPFEMTNVAGVAVNQSVLRQLRNHMKAWMECVGDTHQPPPGLGVARSG